MLSSPDSGLPISSYEILNLAHVADAFVANSMPQSVAGDAP